MQSRIKTGDLVRLRWESAFTDDERAMVGVVLRVRDASAMFMWDPARGAEEEGIGDIEVFDETR